ncbi:MAG TPA: 3-hydroxyacyl-ACP dehydratase FabZ family protein [Rhodocyclaceae bacterium]|nr:3-hydroxyacyl-ACP dehydratase FabZ family protein [Rhodocyclaceae bacterium]
MSSEGGPVRRTTWVVPPDHPAFAGHFPGRPIVPGVLLLDRLIQCAAAATDVAVGIGSAKFLSPVGPGEMLEFSWSRSSAAALRFDITSAGRAVATGTLATTGEA